jgi:predicted LPLAT superfamily acyltransferase
MRQLIAVGVILMLSCLVGLFAWFASAIRRDSRERFQRIQQRIEAQASRIVLDLTRR